MRPSKAAAYGLLSRAYLTMRKYDSAFKYSNLCLGIKNQLMDYNNDPDINGSLSADVPFKPFNKEIIFYSQVDQWLGLNATYQGKIDTTLYASYDNNDWRKTAFFVENTGYQQWKGSYASDAYNMFSGIATDEMYLTRAECYARAGNKNAAMTDLNTLLIKRWMTASWVPLTATDAADALSKILLDRRKELLMPALRWPDIKRLNKEGANIVLKRFISS